MSIIYKLFNSLLSLFKGKKDELLEDKLIEDKDGELIKPIRFAYPDEEETSERTLEQSLKLKQILLTTDKDKKSKIARKTRDPILQAAILETMDIELIIELINNPWVEEEILTVIFIDAKYDNQKIGMELAKRPGLPLSIQRLIAKSDRGEIRKEFLLWQRPINPAIGELFVNDELEENRVILAKNIGVGMKVDNVLFFRGNFEDVQRKLMREGTDKVVFSLASNEGLGPNVQNEMVEFLYYSGNWSGLIILARNKSLKKSAQEKLIEIGKKPTIRLIEVRMMMQALRENKSLDKDLAKSIK